MKHRNNKIQFTVYTWNTKHWEYNNYALMLGLIQIPNRCLSSLPLALLQRSYLLNKIYKIFSIGEMFRMNMCCWGKVTSIILESMFQLCITIFLKNSTFMLTWGTNKTKPTIFMQRKEFFRLPSYPRQYKETKLYCITKEHSLTKESDSFSLYLYFRLIIYEEPKYPTKIQFLL